MQLIREDSKLIHLVINGEEIITTETHPFYVISAVLSMQANLKLEMNCLIQAAIYFQLKILRKLWSMVEGSLKVNAPTSVPCRNDSSMQ
jgi:hypothetical protein